MTEARHSNESENLVAIGRRIIERVRREANNEYSYFDGDEGEDVFRTLYLVPRDMAVPEHLLSDDTLLDIHMDIRQLFFQVFDGVRAELLDHFGRDRGIWIAVDPSVDDHTTAILCTDETVLCIVATKPWNFWWRSEEAMAGDLGRWYTTAAERLVAERQSRPFNHGTRAGV